MLAAATQDGSLSLVWVAIVLKNNQPKKKEQEVIAPAHGASDFS
jgi:hypothetical protein